MIECIYVSALPFKAETLSNGYHTLAVINTAPITLHNRQGSGADDLKTTYDRVHPPALDQLLGKKTDGAWILKVEDKAKADKGKFTLELGY